MHRYVYACVHVQALDFCVHRCDLNDLREHKSELKKLEEVFESLPCTCGNDTRQEVDEDEEEAVEKPLVCFKYCTLH